LNSRISKHGIGKLLVLPGILLTLAACVVLDPQQGTVSAPAARTAVTTRPAPVGSQAEAIPVIAAIDTSAQQALIAEINRDGQAVNIPDFREQVPVPVPVSGANIVELNYEQVDLQVVLEELADALDITISTDPTIADKVSLRTAADRPLGREDIWPLIRLLTRDAGVVIEQVGNIYTARKLSSGLPVEIVTPATLGNGTAGRIMQITPLVYVSAPTAIKVLTPMLAPDGGVIRLTNSNVLAISATESELLRINQLLLLIDADPFSNRGIQLFQLVNANATEVAAELIEILTLIEGEDPAYQVKGIERINAILVTAPARRGFNEISRWIQILDADSQEQVEQLFRYSVRNLNAVDLASTLSSIFEDDDDNRLPALVAEQDETDALALITGTEVDSPDAAPPVSDAAVSANLSVKIVADEATNSLLIRGTARDYRQLLTIISQLDEVPLQVMINAVIAQVTLTDATRFGVDWSRIADNAAIDPISTGTSTVFVPALGGLLFNKTFLDGAARVEATLEAIAVNNNVRLLARPSLTVINNQEGEIQIGSQVPVQQGQTIGIGGQATSNIQYRDTGIVLSITPQINDDGIINLTIRQELSSVDNGASGVNNNPVFNNQEISTTVVVRNGENVVLGGLIQAVVEDLNTGIPLLNELPFVGGLFSFQQQSEERRELFIVIRPEVIDLNAEGSSQYAEILGRFELIGELFETATL
jgi:general secretion pathway protein D